jgi:hypothetical protein
MALTPPLPATAVPCRANNGTIDELYSGHSQSASLPKLMQGEGNRVLRTDLECKECERKKRLTGIPNLSLDSLSVDID